MLSRVPLPPAEAARALRARLGIGDHGPIPDLTEMAEDVLGIPVAVLPLGRDVVGAYATKGGRAFIFISSDSYPARRRFTLAHELGHFALGHAGRIDPVAALGSQVRSPEERDANAFAAELIAPVDAVRRWFDVRGDAKPDRLRDIVKCARYFGASPESMLYRIQRAKLISKGIGSLKEAILAGEHNALVPRIDVAEFRDTLSTESVAIGASRAPRDLLERAGLAVAAELLDAEGAAAMLGIDTAQVEMAAALADIPDDDF